MYCRLCFLPFPLPPLSLETNFLNRCADGRQKRNEGDYIFFLLFFSFSKIPCIKIEIFLYFRTKPYFSAFITL
nr:MAG TPA: hypothetical protein [Caudoviricetes sp.]